MIVKRILAICIALFSYTCNATGITDSDVTSNMQLTVIQRNALSDLYHLSSDRMQGRENNTDGSRLAQRYLIDRYKALNIQAFSEFPEFRQQFSSKRAFTQINGTNVIGFIEANIQSKLQKYIVITAHYDHLGVKAGKTYNGADDNASGVAALLALAAHARSMELQHNLILLATDAEEKGLIGAREALKSFPVPLSQIAFNLNLDMVAQVGKPAKIHLSGTRSTIHFEDLLTKTRSRIVDHTVKLMGEHRNQRKRNSLVRGTNYRRASDHAAFIDYDIPYLYLGVTEHRFYHTEDDGYQTINEKHFLKVINIAKQILIAADLAMQEAEALSSIPQPAAAK